MNWDRKQKSDQLGIYSVPKSIRAKHPGATPDELKRQALIAVLPHVVTIDQGDFTVTSTIVPAAHIQQSVSKINLTQILTQLKISSQWTSVSRKHWSEKYNKWCEENCTGKFAHWRDNKWRFQYQEDAVLFKITWEGE